MPDEEKLRFSIDAKHMSLATVLELCWKRGMAFEDEPGRSEFYRRIEENPTWVRYGTALSHARGTNIGLFGSSELLYVDCAKIMAGELRKLQIENDSHRMFPMNKSWIPKFSAAHFMLRESQRKQHCIIL